jgi:hypothetical protein
MRTLSTKQKLTIAGVTAAVLSTSGVAFAYWSTSGSGSGAGSTSAGTANSLSFTQNPVGVADTSVDLAPMFPGDTAQNLSVRVRNTSSESAYVSTVKAYITTDKSGCTGADFLLGGSPAPSTAATAAGLTWSAQDLAAGAADNATSTVGFNNTGSLQDACKGAAVTLHYVAA